MKTMMEAFELVATVEKGFLLGGTKRFQSEPFANPSDAVARAMALLDANNHCEPICTIRKVSADKPIPDSELYKDMTPVEMLERWPQYKPFIRLDVSSFNRP